MTIPEPDWKRYKELRTAAVERFAQRVIEDSQAICRNDSKTAHQRYLELYALIQERDREIDRIFDDLRRSSAIMCLKLMHDSGLISEEELSAFSVEVHQALGLK